MIKIGKVIGDVIEAGGVKNVTNNYYTDTKVEDAKDVLLCKETDIPDKLKTEEAEEIMEDFVDAGFLNEDWQPNKLTVSERALVAKAICDKLKINEVWQVFGKLWKEKPETLRSYFNKALDQKKSLEYQDKIKNILD